MWAILAVVTFLLCAFGVDHMGAVSLLPVGLAFLALEFAIPWALRRRA